MDKLIIYGKGAFFQRNRDSIPWEQVTAVADSKALGDESMCGVPVIPPDRISRFEYDYVVIFSVKFFDDIREELVKLYFIPVGKIVSWKAVLPGSDGEFQGGFLPWKHFIREKNIKRILDTGQGVLPRYFFDKGEFTGDSSIELDGAGQETYPVYKRLYDHTFRNGLPPGKTYDLLLAWDWNEEVQEMLHGACGCIRYILLHVSYKTVLACGGTEGIEKRLGEYGKIKRFSDDSGIVWSIDTAPGEEKLSDVKIYVVTHKKYNVLNDGMYVPICVGEGYRNASFLNEHEGDNIAYLNPRINECTALYWIWKNTDSEYVGLNHYRRYFYNNGLESMENYLGLEEASRLLRDYDILLAKSEPFECSVSEQLKRTIRDPAAYEKGMETMRQAVGRRQPDYAGAFERVMEGSKFYHCNMFATRRGILDAYCEWLFSFLIEAAECMDTSGYDDYSKRIIGFLAERMLTVWLMKQELKTKELPYSRK